MKEQPRTKVTHFRNRNFKQKNEKTANPAKTWVRTFLRTRKSFT